MTGQSKALPQTSLLTFIKSITQNPKFLGSGAVVFLTLVGLKKYSDSQLRGEERGPATNRRPKKSAFNKEFWKKFKQFLPIIIPSIWSKEFFNLVAIALILFTRTWLDFWMITHNASVLGTVAKRDYKKFIEVIWQLVLMQFPISLVNNLLKYSISKLSLNFRERLTEEMHRKYMQGITYYSVSNLDGRVKNADQLLTQDIENWAESLSKLYSNITKPLVDVAVFFYKLVVQFGWKGPSSMLAYFFMAGALMTRLRVPFGKYTSIQGKIEGDFRHIHSRLITHSEEIAFYGGNKREHTLMNSSFSKLVSHLNKYFTFRLNLGVFDSVITKYSATILGYFLVTKPIFDSSNDAKYTPELGGSTRAIMEDYTRYMRLLVSMVQAVGRLVDAGRELSHFVGYNERVAQLNDVLNDINAGKFERTQVSESEFKEIKGKLKIVDSSSPVISFQNVPIVTPNGDVLIKNLSFEVKFGMNCLVAGPNGCGKSSLFRILGGLWPIYDGLVTRPGSQNLYYVPQKPYLALGSLRDQVVYPDTFEDFKKKGKADQELMRLMGLVELEHIVAREGGWDKVADWADLLSGGEKQRIAMARLYYHKPQFAILDECTSAVSVDVEGKMYNYCKEVGITLFTISHRTTLWKFHEYLLRFDGKGGVEFKQIKPEDLPKDA